MVHEQVCQTHIGSYPKDLIYDANADMYYALVFLNTQYTTIQYTEKVLFEVEYNCESDRVCSKTEFFAVKLGNLKPVHRQTLKDFTILLPLEGFRDGKMRVVKVRSHSQNACGGNFSSFNLSTIDIKSKRLSARRSKKCPGNNEILITSSNISIPVVPFAKTTPGVPVDEPSSNHLVSRKNEIWFKTHREVIIGVLAAFFVMAVAIVLLTLLLCRTYDCNLRRIQDQNQVPLDPRTPDNNHILIRRRGSNPGSYPRAITDTSIDENRYPEIADTSFGSQHSSVSGKR